jgi:SAM-dependent methyltransferase
MRQFLKKSGPLRFTIKSLRLLKNDIFKKIYLIILYYKDLLRAKKNLTNGKFKLEIGDIYPCIFDKTEDTPIGPIYFYQDTWCAKKVFETKPEHHYDIGSKAEMVGIISQFVPTTMIDIRPIKLKLSNLSFAEGDIKNLPFKDGEISSLSSICVIEHIGLGRYGDELDSFGSEKAISEIIRVLSQDGNLFISVPIDSENKIYFNAHRAFTREYVMELFKNLVLIEEKYIYGENLKDKYDKDKGFGTGLYHFKK